MQYSIHHASHPLWFEIHDKWKGRVECHFIFRHYLFLTPLGIFGWYPRTAPNNVTHTISDIYLLLLFVIMSEFLHFGCISILKWILVSFDCIFRTMTKNLFSFQMRIYFWKMELLLQYIWACRCGLRVFIRISWQPHKRPRYYGLINHIWHIVLVPADRGMAWLVKWVR